MSKLNVWIIIKDHFRTLHDFDKISLGAFNSCLFFILPFLIAAVIVFFKLLLNDAVVTIVIGCYTILTGLLLNLLVIIFDIIKNQRVPEDKDRIADVSDFRLKIKLLQETFANISFAILLSIVLALITVCGLSKIIWILLSASFLVYSGTIIFVMTLLMVLKRFHTIVSMELDSKVQ